MLPFIKPRTLRIMTPSGAIVGTGFLVAANQVLTCAHVVVQAGLDGDGNVLVGFTGQAVNFPATPLDDYLNSKQDIALLQMDSVPPGVTPLQMKASSDSQTGHRLLSFGYATSARETGLGATGEFITHTVDETKIQFDSAQVDHGFSGAPVFDQELGAVIGMVNKGKDETGRNQNTTFAISTETIWQAYPHLKPAPTGLPQYHPILAGINLLPFDYHQYIQNFLTEYLGIDSHPIPFGGRAEAVEMLDNWLAGNTPYLLLAAPAGMGKSALLVRWLDSLKTREGLALAFVPVSIRFGTNMERVFYAALAARLAFLHGDDVPTSPETSTAVYRGLVSVYLSKPLVGGRILLVVLDGLDEAADWQIGANFLPTALPAGVRVVVSARFLAGDVDYTSWLRRLNWERCGLASSLALAPLNQAGVRDVLIQMGCPLDELSRKVDIVAGLYHLTAGDPLLVSLYVDDLWAKGDEVARLKSEDLTGLHPGYKGYFDRWWDDQKNLWGNKKSWLEKHVRAVRGLLAGALGPLFRNDFQLLNAELEADYIDDALEVLQRFIIGDNQSQGYTFSHPKLGQYFWEALTLSEQALINGRFLDWGEQTLKEFMAGKRDAKEKDEVSFYVIRNYGAHLAQSQRLIEKWLSLIQYQQWAQAWFTVEGAYSGYLQDVQRVWAQFKCLDRQAIVANGKAPHLGNQIRCALIEASLHSLAGNIPAELLVQLVRHKVWTFAQALVTIRQMSDGKNQAQSIIGLIPYLDHRQLGEALQAVRQIQDNWRRVEVLRALAGHLSPDLLGDALRSAQQIQDEGSRVAALCALVRHLPAELLDEALRAARQVQGEWDRASALRALAERQPELFGEALQAAREIQDKESRAEALFALAERQPELLGEALQAAQQIQDEKPRANALRALVRRLPPELIGEALQAARKISGDESRAEVLCILAERQPELFSEALRVTRNIRTDESRAEALRALSEQQPELLDEAIQAARIIVDERNRASALFALIERQPKLLGDALQAAREIQNEWGRVSALRALAAHLPLALLGEALQDVREIQNDWSRALALFALAERQPELYSDAILAARQIQAEDSRAEALHALAAHLPSILLGEAIQAAREIQNAGSRAEALSALTERRPDLLVEAIQSAREINDAEICTNVLCSLAAHLPSDLLGEALQAAREIHAEKSRAEALSVLTEHLPPYLLGEALKAIREIRDKRNRVLALSALAKIPSHLLGGALQVVREIPDDKNRAEALCAITAHLPLELLSMALQVAQEIQVDEGRAAALRALVPHLPPELFGEALQTAREIQDGTSRARALFTLAEHQPELLDEALKAAREIKDGTSRARALLTLAKRQPELLDEALKATQGIQVDFSRAKTLRFLAERQPELLGEALQAAQEIHDEKSRTEALRALAEHLPPFHLDMALRGIRDEGRRALALCALARHLFSPELLSEAIQAVWLIRDDESRAKVLCALAEHLPPYLLSEALQAARLIRDDESRAKVLRALAERQPELLGEAMQAAREIQDERLRAGALSALAERLSPELLGEALQAARQIQADESRAVALSALAKRQPELLGEALQAARKIQSVESRAVAISTLAYGIAHLPLLQCYLLIEETLPLLATHPRPAALADIAALMEPILACGTDSTPFEIAQAIKDVSTWWP